MDNESRKATPQAAQKAAPADPNAAVVANILKKLDLDGNGKTSHKEAMTFIAGNLEYLCELATEIARSPSSAQSTAHSAKIIAYSADTNALLLKAILEDKSRDKTLIVKDVLKVLNAPNK
ncbi:hypothetical protein IAE39_005558 [Pseudomonas sp. S37]|uniref:hypothetical protein n=1 Tax=Pseudomonas sp. S37 TaxID=2767449 RepID=UPI00191324D3|nr:hypothetical protein [Pseudomonas sp. S37]MBK4997384.1 hypothetical protein [Pseudomonas sp. S37]